MPSGQVLAVRHERSGGKIIERSRQVTFGIHTSNSKVNSYSSLVYRLFYSIRLGRVCSLKVSPYFDKCYSTLPLNSARIVEEWNKQTSYKRNSFSDDANYYFEICSYQAHCLVLIAVIHWSLSSSLTGSLVPGANWYVYKWSEFIHSWLRGKDCTYSFTSTSVYVTMRGSAVLMASEDTTLVWSAAKVDGSRLDRANCLFSNVSYV